MIDEPNKSAIGLLTDALAHVSSLVRSEVDLAVAEKSSSVAQTSHFAIVANAMRAWLASLPVLESSACAAFLAFILLN